MFAAYPKNNGQSCFPGVPDQHEAPEHRQERGRDVGERPAQGCPALQPTEHPRNSGTGSGIGQGESENVPELKKKFRSRSLKYTTVLDFVLCAIKLSFPLTPRFHTGLTCSRQPSVAGSNLRAYLILNV